MLNTPHIPRVLVVDDELLIRWALREALEAKGYTVNEAADAAAALIASSASCSRFHQMADLVANALAAR